MGIFFRPQFEFALSNAVKVRCQSLGVAMLLGLDIILQTIHGEIDQRLGIFLPHTEGNGVKRCFGGSGIEKIMTGGSSRLNDQVAGQVFLLGRQRQVGDGRRQLKLGEGRQFHQVGRVKNASLEVGCGKEVQLFGAIQAIDNGCIPTCPQQFV